MGHIRRETRYVLGDPFIFNLYIFRGDARDALPVLVNNPKDNRDFPDIRFKYRSMNAFFLLPAGNRAGYQTDSYGGKNRFPTPPADLAPSLRQ
jgi:hypothetical protein